MKKSLYLASFLSLLSTSLFAQIGGIEDSVNDVGDTIRTIFPILLGVIFLVGFLFNAGHFFGENADLKKGIILSKNIYDTEASGGVTLKNVKKIASTGVKRISVGQITHSTPGINFKLEI